MKIFTSNIHIKSVSLSLFLLNLRYDLVETITEGIENLLGDSIDKHVNDMFSTTKFDGDIDNQNKTARAICDEIVNTKEYN